MPLHCFVSAVEIASMSAWSFRILSCIVLTQRDMAKIFPLANTQTNR